MIFHITTKKNWEESIPDFIYVNDSLESEGFIHCSTGEQVLATACRYYSGRGDLVLMAISEAELDVPLMYENLLGGDELFPHLYGPLNLTAVKQVCNFPPSSDGTFEMPKDYLFNPFWRIKPLAELSRTEWESLCDGCARCCLYKLQDIDTDEFLYTNVACRYLNPENCRCTAYLERSTVMPTCITLTPEMIPELKWMPNTCAYRLLSEGKDLQWWHPLVSGSTDTVELAEISIKDFYIPELEVDLDDLSDYVVEWLNWV